MYSSYALNNHLRSRVSIIFHIFQPGLTVLKPERVGKPWRKILSFRNC